MNFNEYQIEASRTINETLPPWDVESHSLHGMVGEIGELHSLYQKKYQGHGFDDNHAKKEVGDLLWFIAEYCTARNWSMDEIAQLNIEKLRARYPDGFDMNKSIYRAKGDI